MNAANAGSREHDFVQLTDYYDSLIVKLVSSTPGRDGDDSEAIY